LGWDDSGIPSDEGIKKDEAVENAKAAIEEIVTQQKVVTDREVKVRLEDKFFPWVVGRSLLSLEGDGLVKRVGVAGLKGKGVPEAYYALEGTQYSQILGLIQEKRDVSLAVNNILTGYAPAGLQAEVLFERAFLSLGFDIRGRNISEYKGKKVRGVEGKEPPNLDFILRRDDVEYGVDVKNWIRYEWTTRRSVVMKVGLALQLGVVPFFIAGYVDRDVMFREIIGKGGICYPYKTLLIPPIFDSVATKASSLLGYPVIAVDTLPVYKTKWIGKLHADLRKKRG